MFVFRTTTCVVCIYGISSQGRYDVGVPLISPVEESMLSPVGKEGSIDQDVTVPPPDTLE